MMRTIISAAVLAGLLAGCGTAKRAWEWTEDAVTYDPASQEGPAVVWVEGEDYVGGPANQQVGVGRKDPASGLQALYGPALASRGGFAEWQAEVPQAYADARMLIRYARYHFRPMEAATVTVRVVSDWLDISRTVRLEDTGGWGTDAAGQWGIAEVDLGPLAAGTYLVRMTSETEEFGDANIDGFFIVPTGTVITAAELAAADRIHITGDGYEGLGVPARVFRQDQVEYLPFPVRSFSPAGRTLRATVRGAGGGTATVLADVEDLQINNRSRVFLVNAEQMNALPDGAYVLRAEWNGAPVQAIEIQLVGELSAAFDERLAAIAGRAERLAEADGPEAALYGADFADAVDFLTGAWADVAKGTATKPTLASIRRTLEQYESVTAKLNAGEDPYAGRTGDLRRAFWSEATGLLEPYRLFVPDGYTPDGSTPLVVALNHHVDAFLDQADGVVKRIANERGWMILAPGAVGTTEATAEYEGSGRQDLNQVLDLVLEQYPGIDRDRVFCTGPSRGGFGTYHWATNDPDRFAAIACVSGVGNWNREAGVLVERFAPMPTLILHGEIDTLVPPVVARTVAADLAERDIPHELHVFDSHGHSYENYAEQYFALTLDYFDRVAPPPARAPATMPAEEPDEEPAEAAPDETTAGPDPRGPDATMAESAAGEPMAVPLNAGADGH